MNYFTYQIDNLLTLLGTPEGILALLGLVFLAVLLLAKQGAKWFVLGILLMVATFGFNPYTGKNLITPLQQIRAHSRAIGVAMLLLLLIPTIRAPAGWRRGVLGGTVLLFIYHLIVSLRGLTEPDPTKAALSLVSYVLMFLTLGIGLSLWVQSLADAHRLLRLLAVTGLFFVAASLVQYAVNPGQVVWHTRLIGVAGNPQHAAMTLAVSLTPTAYLVASPHETRWFKTALACGAGFFVVLLIWTGSRTGLLVSTISLAVLFRQRIRGVVLLCLLGGAFTFLALQIYQEAGASAGRLLSTEDTRSAAWGRMYSDFMSSLFVGLPQEESAFSENSYLLVAARTGLMGLIPFLLAVALVLVSLVRVLPSRSRMGEYAILVDLVTAGIAGILVGAIFEGYFFSTFSLPVYAFFVYLALLKFLQDLAAATAPAPLASEAEDIFGGDGKFYASSPP